MPILPLDHPEPFAATLGVMLYPGTELAEQCRARAFAAQYLGEPIRHLYEAGQTLSPEVLLRLVVDAGETLPDLQKRWRDATTTGELFTILFALFHTDEALASWNNASLVAQRVAARLKRTGARSAFWHARRRFLSVAHLWGAWCMREGKFAERPEVDYDGYDDFQAFLTEAETLRQWGQGWRPRRAKSTSALPPDVWRVPEEWRPPLPKPGWPRTDGIRVFTVPEELLEECSSRNLMLAGQPREHATMLP